MRTIDKPTHHIQASPWQFEKQSQAPLNNRAESAPKSRQLRRALGAIAMFTGLTAGGLVGNAYAEKYMYPSNEDDSTISDSSTVAIDTLPLVASSFEVGENVVAPTLVEMSPDLIQEDGSIEANTIAVDLSKTPEVNGVAPDRTAFIVEALLNMQVNGEPITVQAATMMAGNFARESWSNPGTVNQLEDAQGLGQWRQNRRNAVGYDLPMPSSGDSSNEEQQAVISLQLKWMLDDMRADQKTMGGKGFVEGQQHNYDILSVLTDPEATTEDIFTQIVMWERPANDGKDGRREFGVRIYEAVTS